MNKIPRLAVVDNGSPSMAHLIALLSAQGMAPHILTADVPRKQESSAASEWTTTPAAKAIKDKAIAKEQRRRERNLRNAARAAQEVKK